MIHDIDILGCGVIYIDNERVFGSKPYGLFSTVNWKATDEDLKRIADKCLEVIAEQTEPKDKPQTCDTCKYGKDKHRYAHICNECGVGINNYEPKTESNGDNLSPLDELQTMYYPQVDGITPSVILPKTKPQTVIDKAKADIAKWSLWSKTYEAMYNDKPQTERESE